jgi:hypothetical protein
MPEQITEPIMEIDENPEVTTRRIKTMVINPIGFMSLFTQGLRFRKQTQIVSGVPEDARLVGMAYDTRRDLVLMMIESASFDEVPVTEQPPFLMLKIQTQFGITKKKNVPKRKK